MIFRRKFITHKKVQFRLASIFLVWFFVFISIFGAIYVFNFSAASNRTEGMLIHDQLLTKMLLVDQTKDLAIWYGLAAVVYIIFCWGYLLIYSHRLTGPIYKMNMILDKAIKNRSFPERIKFRKEDAFHDLADKFNEWLDVVHPEGNKPSKASDYNPDIVKSPKE